MSKRRSKQPPNYEAIDRARDTLRQPHLVDEPSVSERAMLDLAAHLSREAGNQRVISAHHQAVAYRYVRRFGWEAALGRMGYGTRSTKDESP